MVMPADVATVKRAEYREVVNPMWDGEIMRSGSKLVPPTLDALVVTVDHRGEEREMVIANTEWSTDNVALQFLAFCGAKPSDLEPVEGTHVQVVEDDDGNLWPTDKSMDAGEKKLERSDWFNSDI